MSLSEDQLHKQRFYNDFGYLYLPGLFAGEIDWITEEFERVLRDNGVAYDSTERRGCSSVIEQSERLCTLIEHPGLVDVMTAVLGDDYNYTGSSGELMVGGGQWHPDGRFPLVRYAKMIMYLDHLTPETGGLRVVPGSHLQDWPAANIDTQARWGIGPEEVPCMSPENRPGDAILFNLHTLHNALGGGNRRRLLAMGFSARCHTPEQFDDLKKRLVTPPYSDIMLGTATPERMRHLRQPLELAAQEKSA